MGAERRWEKVGEKVVGKSGGKRQWEKAVGKGGGKRRWEKGGGKRRWEKAAGKGDGKRNGEKGGWECKRRDKEKDDGKIRSDTLWVEKTVENTKGKIRREKKMEK
jgi:hypothetical protein